MPDRLVTQMVLERLGQPDCADGFVLDGYPRTLAQVDALDVMLADLGCSLDAVIELTVDVPEVVARLLRRAEIEGRSDDTEDVIRHRQDVYAEQTAPLVDVYSERGLLVPVDGMGDIDDVTGRLTSALQPSVG